MTPLSAIAAIGRRQRWGADAAAYFQLAKPRVVALIVFTAMVGMLLAPASTRSLATFVFATLGIALVAAAAAAFNHVLERRTDALMARTRSRPLPTHRLSTRQAVTYAAVLMAVAIWVLVVHVNAVTAALAVGALLGYSVVYTVLLKPRTPQNIVIGGAAGAAPPLLGWTAMTGSVSVDALLLFLIIFLWTPPHFWSLALYRSDDYAKAGLPMLPLTHGRLYTCRSILAYTLALAVASVLPFATGMCGIVYLAGALPLNAGFVRLAWQLLQSDSDAVACKTFHYSIRYLAALFALMLLDHYGSALAATIELLRPVALS